MAWPSEASHLPKEGLRRHAHRSSHGGTRAPNRVVTAPHMSELARARGADIREAEMRDGGERRKKRPTRWGEWITWREKREIREIKRGEQ